MHGSARQQGVSFGVGSMTRFKLQDADAISRLLQVRRVSPFVSGFSIALSTLFSIVVGIGFSLCSAHQVYKLNPIEALRRE